jgi:hypothetical protein
MYQINNRFFIGLLIVIAITSLFLLTKNPFIFIPAYLIVVGIYTTVYFWSLKLLNDMQKSREQFYKEHEGQEYVELTPKEYKQMKKEGAFEKDGKYMIDEDYSEWKKAKEAIRVSTQLQSLQERN